MPQAASLSNAKAVLFDVDGTLVDSLGSIVAGLRDAFNRFAGVNPSDDEIKKLIGLPLRKQLRLYGMEDISDEELQKRIEFTMERFEETKHLEVVFPAAIATLRLVHGAGLKTALVTSKSGPELELFLERFEAADAVHVTVCASDVVHPKPDRESALLACERLGVAPEEAVMIGDSIYDLRCARDAGCIPIGVAYGSTPLPTLEREAPAALFETPEALLAWAEQGLLQPTWPERSFSKQT
jgi:HAD superfamily hydrolase (TIGR01549 family)